MNLVQMSLTAGILIVGIMAFRFFFVHRLPKGVMVLLWEIAILRLLLPFALPLPAPGIGSLGNIKDRQGIVKVETAVGAAEAEYDGKQVVTTTITSQGLEGNLKLVLWLAYFLGAGGMMAGSFYLYHRDSQLFREGLPMPERERALLLAAVGEAGRRWLKKVRFQVSDRTATPVTYGIFRPAIVFPKGIGQTQGREAGLCLAHELVHIRNHDNLKKVVAHLALCIHWFNPLVWALYFTYSRDMELLCDEIVVRRAGSSRDYAMALLSMAQQRAAGFRMGMGFGKNAVKERIAAVMKIRRLSAVGALVAAIAVTAALTVFVTGPGDARAEELNGASYAVDWQMEDAQPQEGGAEAVAWYTVGLTQEQGGEETASADSSMAMEAVTTDREGEADKSSIKSIMEAYQDFGMSVEAMGDDYQLYYQGEPVYFFADNEIPIEEGFSGRLFLRPAGGTNGDTGVVTEYGGDGKIKGVQQLSPRESAAYTKRWR